MQPAVFLRAIRKWLAFQSSLELSPECNKQTIADIFISKPVSILTRAFARVQPKHVVSGVFGRGVSILTRAFARVQRPGKVRLVVEPIGFNPHSSFRPSATVRLVLREVLELVSILTRAFARVQRRESVLFLATARVSILTRAFARVQPAPRYTLTMRVMFQSSLELSPECNASATWGLGGRASPFQSSLELSPECNL